MTFNLLDEPIPLKIAHKGYSLAYPENTLLAMEKAFLYNADILETDLCLSRDGELVLSHDLTIDRQTDGKGLIRQYTVEELQTFDGAYNFTLDGKTYPFRGKGIQIPTARQLFEKFGKSTYYNLDLKDPNPNSVDVFLDLIETFDLSNNIIMGSFHKNHVLQVRCRNPSIFTNATYDEARNLVLTSKIHLERITKYPVYDVIQIPIYRKGVRILTSRLLQVMHNYDIKVHVWTINDPQQMNYLLDLGIDGIFSDDIKTLDKIMTEYSNSSQYLHIISNPRFEGIM